MPWYTTAHARRDAERQTAKKTMSTTDSVELLGRCLSDSGAAFCLASRLQISILYQVSGVEARAYKGEFHIVNVPVSYETGDVEAASRRAVWAVASKVVSNAT